MRTVASRLEHGRSGDSGVHDVMGKDYGAFSPRHVTDRDGHNGLGQF